MYILSIKLDCALRNLKLYSVVGDWLFKKKFMCESYCDALFRNSCLQLDKVKWASSHKQINFLIIIYYREYNSCIYSLHNTIRGQWSCQYFIRYCSSMNIWFRWSTKLGVQRLRIKSQYIINALIHKGRGGGEGGCNFKTGQNNLKECR